MEKVSQIEPSLKQVLEERANVLARETGCIERQRKFSGADLVQTLVFGWLTHPDASLETLASMATIREVEVSDTAIHKRFTASCARFLHAVLEEMVTVLVCAEQPVPLELLHRFTSVVLEDSSRIALPKELADCWAGSGGGSGGGEAAIKLHVRWDLTHGQLTGPSLTDGRVSDQCSPFHEASLPTGSLYIADLGYFDLDAVLERRKAGSYTLTRARSNTAFFTEQGRRLRLQAVLPQRVGQTKELHVLVGKRASVSDATVDGSCAIRCGRAATPASAQGCIAASTASLGAGSGIGGLDDPSERCAIQTLAPGGSVSSAPRAMANRMAFQALEAVRAH